MNPPDLRRCTLGELHEFVSQWVDAQDQDGDTSEWGDWDD